MHASGRRNRQTVGKAVLIYPGIVVSYETIYLQSGHDAAVLAQSEFLHRKMSMAMCRQSPMLEALHDMVECFSARHVQSGEIVDPIVSTGMSSGRSWAL
ncbi:MAG: hypothetical protein EOR12_31095 [Mesorhizobium sp.]|uniref:hypothetical protein n=1 Tax=Mesorhizobium sp. TaxID=1871066 RepID=UPI000FE91D87|nr:hypothetical protein [Mesorhizobium sp.]RWP83460.1 MAG: hypothetical protein EOR12_31095 [Mesorhizobium sp.]